MGISTTENNRIAISEKLRLFFTCVCDSQLAAGTSLALFGGMNEWQRVLFLKRELSRLFRVSKMFIY